MVDTTKQPVIGGTPPEGWDPERHAEITARVAQWDAGESVWTLDMGGMGPGYEQAIQLLAIEMLRDALAAPLPVAGADGAEEVWEHWGERAHKRTAHNGYSGAQYGAAKWLAHRLCVEGWESLNRRAKEKGDEERAIQASSHWPTLQPAT